MRAIYDVQAPAKVNLFLHVVGRRSDGYHLLQSACQLIDWADVLHFERRDDGALRRHDLGPRLPDQDLCLRAALALQRASGTHWGTDISIDKRLPWGAGLGGGSSDAASTLLALNRLWALGWPRARLAEIGLQLGADVPLFIGGRNALVEGIGERLTALDAPLQWLAVVKPAASLASADVFASPQLVRNTPPVILSSFLGNASNASKPGLFDGFGGNDLQPPAQSLCPEVTAVALWLQARFGNSRMTGSGSAVFARAGTGEKPVATWSIDEVPLRWVARMCRSLPEHPLVGWAD